MRRLALATVVAALAAAWWWPPAARRPAAARPAAPVAVAAAAPLAHRAAAEDALRAAGAAAPRLWAPPASLDGTAADGALATGADGRLIVSPDLRRAFDYWFAASGEEPEERIAARIAAAIRARLDDPAEAAALALLARFVTYRERGRALAAGVGAAADLAARAGALRALRREVFGADAEALFADEEALVAAALAERALAGDPALGEVERARRLAELRAAAPAPIRAAREAATAPLRLAGDEAVLRARGAAAEDIRRLREARVGAAAADRLAALDVARAAWRERIATYRAERAAIDGDPALDDGARAAAIDALRARRFSGAELARVDALDRLETDSPDPE